MSRKHTNIAAPRNPAADPSPSAPRHRMLYGLIGLSAVAIAAAILATRTPAPEPAPSIEARAATVEAPRQAAAATRSLASFAPFHDFGTISMAAGKVTHRYVITNLASTPLNITQLSTSCMCTEATLVMPTARRGPFGMPGHGPIPTIRETLGPRERAQVEVVFDPAAHGPAGVGLIERTVSVRNDAGEPLQLAFKATVRP